MFKKRTIIIGLILLLAIGVIAALGWAELKRVEEKGEEIQQEGILSTESKIEEKIDAGKMLEEIRKDYDRKMAILLETYRQKLKSIKSTSTAEWNNEYYQLRLWRDEQKRLLEQEKERKEKEIAEKYLEHYVMKEVLFIPEASRIDVDKDGNLWVWDGKNNRVFKYVKEKKVASIHFSEILYGREKLPFSKVKNEEKDRYKWVIPSDKEKKPILIEKFSSDYRYKFYTDKDGKAIVEIEDSSGKLQGRIEGKEDSGYPFAIDAKGNVYMLSDNTFIRSLGVEDLILKIQKYSKEGTLLAIINLSKDYFGEIDWEQRQYMTLSQRELGYIDIDKDGNIYQLVPTTPKKDKVHILKWERK